MKSAPIKNILLNEKNHLQVFPDTSISGDFEFIWRDASGVRWDASVNALVAAEPDRWDSELLFQQILCAAASEYGCRLYIDKDTDWTNISDGLREKILSGEQSVAKMYPK